MKKEKFRFFALILSLITIFFMLFSSQIVSADGGIFVDFGEHVHLPSQKAAIFWDGTNETMVISTKINSSNLSNMAWVTPVQSSEIPNVSEGNAEIFDDIAYSFGEYTGGGFYSSNPIFFLLFIFSSIGIIFLICIFFLKKIRLNYFFIILFILIICASFSLFIYIYSSGMGANSSYDGVELIEMKTVDFYDVAVLKATNATNLVGWLEENEFVVPEESISILQEYCDQDDYYFVVNKIDINNSEELADSVYNQIEEKIEEMKSIYKNLSALNIDYFELSHTILKYGLLPLDDVALDIFTAEPYNSATSNIDGLFNILNLTEEEYESLINRYPIDTTLSEGFCSFDLNICYPYTYWLKSSLVNDVTILWKENGQQKELVIENEKTSDKKTINLEDDWWKNELGISSLNESEIIFLEDSIPKIQACYQELVLIKEYSENLEPCLKCYEIEEQIIDIINNFSGDQIYSLREYSDTAEYTELNENNMYDGSFINNTIQYCLDIRVNRIKQELEEGIATPLEIIFQPKIPMYPMKMSSINKGDTKINVYFISNYYVDDSAGLLSTKGNSGYYSTAPGFNYDVGNYVTWMTFEGDTKDLIADSYFVEI